MIRGIVDQVARDVPYSADGLIHHRVAVAEPRTLAEKRHVEDGKSCGKRVVLAALPSSLPIEREGDRPAPQHRPDRGGRKANAHAG
eukprot:CAMPEP_0168457922 /NCGR_PEP_ID=MMETSP0228-20121227/52110_1 /TAXON_ID=133427 /ORGANISM="Protoceratium reticulatum, Strain CCCM 535 (=CCMP 1889)" /LENGTH=85 /DNA_ID=CAMNT_0008473003 /DNA_START=353 /DNA_END=610 /DNA_ORIENTATION=+